MTRDGGKNWVELMKGSCVYDYADHGGILVLVHNQVLTNTLYYSLNEGKDWIPYQFTNDSAVIINVFNIDPSRKKVVLLGKQNNKVVYWGINFSDIHEKNCDNSDYEYWSPDDEADYCILGHRILYKRRKQDAECHSDINMDHVENITNCNCTVDDYECDWGFERTQLSQKCVKVIDQIVPSPCYGTYKVSQGYRKIPGDTCVNHLDKYKTLTYLCPAAEMKIEPFPTVVIIIMVIGGLLLIIGLIFVGMIIGLRSEWVRRTFPWIQKAPQWINITLSMDKDESSGIDIEESEINLKKENSQHDTTDFEDVF